MLLSIRMMRKDLSEISTSKCNGPILIGSYEDAMQLTSQFEPSDYLKRIYGRSA